MSIHAADEVVCVGRRVNQGRPEALVDYRSLHYSGKSKQKDATIQVPHQSKVSLESNELKAKETFPADAYGMPFPTSAGADDIGRRDCFFRPKSAKFVLQYADAPIEITNHHLGKPTRASILRNLKRSQSASSVCSDFSWIQGNRRLCNIRNYYRLYKPETVKSNTINGEPIQGYLTGGRFTNTRWLDSVALKTKGLYIHKHDRKNVFLVKTTPTISNEDRQRYGTKQKNEDLEINGKKIMKDATVNTDDHFLSIHRWHGATWQRHLPEMYQPNEEKYNPYASAVVRAKQVKSEYRDPMTMSFTKKNQS